MTMPEANEASTADPQASPPPDAAQDQGGDAACWAHLFEDEVPVSDSVQDARPRLSITTPFCRLLGIEHPILLAPMGGVAGGCLAAAVSSAGGLGVIGAGYGHRPWLEAELDAAGDARVGVGFITFALDSRLELLSMILERRPPAVQLSFGDPEPYADLIHSAGALLICQIQSVADAIAACAAGADVIVAQGQDGGGHGRPGRGTVGLVPSVVDAVAPVPVLAAGGLADGRGLAAALLLGASGISLGTRFYAAAEAIADDAARAALVAATGDNTVRTSVFDVIRGPAWPDGHDGRALRNRTVDRWHQSPQELATHLDEVVADYRGAADDDYSIKPLWAGEGLDLIRGTTGAGAIVADVVETAALLINRASQDLVVARASEGDAHRQRAASS